jgi:hypothetical protein
MVLISSDGREALAGLDDTIDDETARTMLSGMVLVELLWSRGRLCLHGAAVGLPQGAVAFVGPSGSGKSTLAAAMMNAGHPLLTDELLILEPASDGTRVWPLLREVRLDEGTARELFDPAAVSGAPDRHDKRVFRSPPPRSHRSETRLVSLFALAHGTEVALRPLTGARAHEAVWSSLFATRTSPDAARAAGFQAAAEVIDHVPVERLTLPNTLSHLPETCRRIAAAASDHANR